MVYFVYPGCVYNEEKQVRFWSLEEAKQYAKKVADAIGFATIWDQKNMLQVVKRA